MLHTGWISIAIASTNARTLFFLCHVLVKRIEISEIVVAKNIMQASHIESSVCLFVCFSRQNSPLRDRWGPWAVEGILLIIQGKARY